MRGRRALPNHDIHPVALGELRRHDLHSVARLNANDLFNALHWFVLRELVPGRGLLDFSTARDRDKACRIAPPADEYVFLKAPVVRWLKTHALNAEKVAGEGRRPSRRQEEIAPRPTARALRSR